MPETQEQVEHKEAISIIVRDGVLLNGYEWTSENPSAAICLVHGLGEHVGRYIHVANFFTANNISFYAFDLRGHGLSEGKRGHTPSMERSLDDIEEMLMYVRSEHNDLPLFLYGHSLGGIFATNYLLTKNTNELKGAIISSPWFRVINTPTKIELDLAKLVNKFWPSLTQSNRLDNNSLTYLEEVNQAYVNDPLVHDRISVRLFNECHYCGQWAMDHSDRLKLPAYMFHGADDEITDPEASEEFANYTKSFVDFKIWDETKHEPHNDQHQSDVLAGIQNWIQAHI